MASRIKHMAWVAALAASAAGASPYTEVGDAGETLSGAQFIGAGVDVIHGNMGAASADLYAFSWAGGAFTVDTFGSVADTQLFLFNAAGQGVWANDQADASTSDSRITDPALAAGLYYIGVSVFDYDPFSTAGPMFPSAPFVGQFGPSNSGTLDHWALFSHHPASVGEYVIHFSAPTGAVAEPGTLALLGLGLATAGAASRRVRRGVPGAPASSA